MARVAIPQQENLVLRSESMSNATWIKGTGVTVTDGTPDVADPLGGNTASKVVYDGSGAVGSFILAQTVLGGAVLPASRFFSAGVWIRLAAGTKTIRSTLNADLTYANWNLTAAWQKFTTRNGCLAGLAVQFTFYRTVADALALTFYAWHPQVAAANRLGPYALTVATAVIGPVRNAISGDVNT
jgi:hypothetical protein